MAPRLLRIVPILLALSCGPSCTLARGAQPALAGGPNSVPAAAPAAAAPAPAAAPVAPAPAAAPVAEAVAVRPAPLTADELPDIRLNSQAPALTETLARALDMLDEARVENAKLKEQIASVEKTLADKEGAMQGLGEQLAQAETRIQQFEEALEKWKQDVLGFRDEMRAYEEAEIEVLQEMAVLLRGFKKQSEAQ